MKEMHIRFPEEMYEVLEKFRKTTGDSASSYIRRATAIQMVKDNLININIKERVHKPSCKIGLGDPSSSISGYEHDQEYCNLNCAE